MTAIATLPPTGHNSGQVPLTEMLASAYEPLALDITCALAAARELPETVETDQHVEAYTAASKQLAALAKRAEERRKIEKEPHLQAGRDVDAFFKTFADRLDKATGVLRTRVGVYLSKKAAEERARREEQERKAREEAELRLRQAAEAEEAKKGLVADLALDAAADAERKAAGYAQAAAAPVADLARTKTEAGTAGLKTEWTFRIDDLSKVDLNALRAFIPQSAVEQALRAAVRAGVRQAPGVTIYETEKATFR